jgi:NADPH:quinone reductase-like Zn-dependent oxidoreductase
VEALEWEELPLVSPGRGEVMVRVRACALNRLDLWVRNGVEGHTFPLPLIPGSEISGIVEQTSEEVDDYVVGDPVLIAPGLSCGICEKCLGDQDMLCKHYGILGETRNGGYAEFVAVPRRNILPHPKGLTFIESAAIPLTFLTAWHMLVSRAALQHEDILIHAAGSGVSSAAIQIARVLGAKRIIVTAGSDTKLQAATKLGATHAINYQKTNFVEDVRDIVGKKGVEVVVDHVGGKTFEKSLNLLAWGGRIVLCGATSDAAVKLNLRPVFFKSLSILGSTMGSLQELRQVLELFDSGDLRPTVDRTFPLIEAPAAQKFLESRQQFGKVVLTVGDYATASAVAKP